MKKFQNGKIWETKGREMKRTKKMRQENMWFMLIVTIWLLVISVMDVRSRCVPFRILAAGGICTALILVIQCGYDMEEYAQAARGAIPGILLLVFGAVTKKSGYGDGIAVLLVGMLLRDGKIFLLLGFSLFLISICSLILLVFKKVRRSTKIPYLPFLTAAWLMVMAL